MASDAQCLSLFVTVSCWLELFVCCADLLAWMICGANVFLVCSRSCCLFLQAVSPRLAVCFSLRRSLFLISFELNAALFSALALFTFLTALSSFCFQALVALLSENPPFDNWTLIPLASSSAVFGNCKNFDV